LNIIYAVLVRFLAGFGVAPDATLFFDLRFFAIAFFDVCFGIY